MQQRGAGGGMVHAVVAAGQHTVEGGIVFAEIMVAAGQSRRCRQTQTLAPFRCQPGGAVQMIGQQLPVAAVGKFAGMGVEFHGSHVLPLS